MTDDTDPVLAHLQRLDGRLENLREGLREVRHRLGALEESHAGLSRRLDRQGERLDRIESRVDALP